MNHSDYDYEMFGRHCAGAHPHEFAAYLKAIAVAQARNEVERIKDRLAHATVELANLEAP